MLIRAFGPSEVLRRLFKLAQTAPEELAPVLQAVAEARAVRPWELFDEGIVSWQIFTTRAAFVAEFSMIGLTGFNNPGQWLVLVEEIRPLPGSGNIEIRLSGAAVVFNNAAIVRAKYRDARAGNALTDAPPIFTAGTNAALVGSVMDEVAPNVAPGWSRSPFILPFGLPVGGTANILYVASTATNTALRVMFRGLAIPWRDR